MEAYLDEYNVFHEEQFNVIRGWNRTGRIFDIDSNRSWIDPRVSGGEIMKPTEYCFSRLLTGLFLPSSEREERLLYTRDQLFEEGIMDCRRLKNTNSIS